MKRRTVLSLSVFATIALACNDVHAPLDPESGLTEADGGAPEQSWTSQSFESVAHALALAINEDEVARSAVRNILRDSPWSGHRVTLQELVQADEGAAVIAAAARFLGETSAAFRSRVDSLPGLDLLMPRRLHRETWRATPGVFLLATLNPESDRYVIVEPDGRTQPGTGSFDLDQTHLLLQPAEPRVAREDRQPLGVGDVIQVRTNTQGGAFSDRGSHAEITSHAGTDVTYVDYIFSHRDDGGVDGIVEIRLDATFYNELGQAVRDTAWRLDFETEQDYFPHTVIISEVVPDSSVHFIRIHAWELDGGFNGDDDDFGARDFFWSDRGQRRSIIGSVPNIDLTLGWIQRPASVVSDIDLFPSSIEMDPESSRYVYARVYDQYEYRLNDPVSWSIDNTSVATVTPDGNQRAIVTSSRFGAGRTTTVRATASGVQGTGTISVTSCINDVCPEFTGTVEVAGTRR